MTKPDKKLYPLISTGTLLPAYGRDYKTAKAVLMDFRSGKDFIIRYTGNADCYTYCNIKDCVIGETVKIRYDNQTHLVIYTITPQDFVQNN